MEKCCRGWDCRACGLAMCHSLFIHKEAEKSMLIFGSIPVRRG